MQKEFYWIVHGAELIFSKAYLILLNCRSTLVIKGLTEQKILIA